MLAEVEPEMMKFLVFPTILVCFNFVLDLLTIWGTITKVRKSLQIRTVKSRKIRIFYFFSFYALKIRTFT